MLLRADNVGYRQPPIAYLQLQFTLKLQMRWSPSTEIEKGQPYILLFSWDNRHSITCSFLHNTLLHHPNGPSKIFLLRQYTRQSTAGQTSSEISTNWKNLMLSLFCLALVIMQRVDMEGFGWIWMDLDGWT